MSEPVPRFVVVPDPNYRHFWLVYDAKRRKYSTYYTERNRADEAAATFNRVAEAGYRVKMR